MSAVRSLLNRALDSRVLPARRLEAMPALQIPNQIDHGRSVYEGYQRGWGLEFAGLDRKVARDPLFREAFAAAKRDPATRTVVHYLRLMNIYLIIRFYLPALRSHNIVEFGSYLGGSALFMALLLKRLYPGARVFALDTFEGMPETDPTKDLHSAGDFSGVDVRNISKAAERLGLDNLVIVKGLIEDTAADVYREAGDFGLAHLDLDIYSALKYAQESVLPVMTPGGYIVYDDATVSSCIGATQAVEELIRDHHLHSEQIFPHFVFRAGLETDR